MLYMLNFTFLNSSSDFSELKYWAKAYIKALAGLGYNSKSPGVNGNLFTEFDTLQPSLYLQLYKMPITRTSKLLQTVFSWSEQIRMGILKDSLTKDLSMYIERHVQWKAYRTTEVILNFMLETWTQLALWKPPDLLAGWWGIEWISFCIQEVWLLDGIFNLSKTRVFKKERCILITLIMLSFIKSYITKCHHHSKAISQEIFRRWSIWLLFLQGC